MKKYTNEIIATIVLILVFCFGSIAGVILDRGGDYPFLKSEADYLAEITIEPEDGWEQVDTHIDPSGKIREYGGWYDPELRIGYNDHDGYYVCTKYRGEVLEDGTVVDCGCCWIHCDKEVLAAWITGGENGMFTAMANRLTWR